MDVIRELKVAPFVAGKLLSQVRQFTLPALEAIYHQLLELDEAAKTSQMDGDLGVDLLIAALTN
jgi:DNA polymerase III delta subunit